MDAAALRRRFFFLAAACLLLTPVALAIDLPVAQFCQARHVPSDVRKIVTLAEVFAHGAGVALILLAVGSLDPGGWRRLPVLAGTAFGAGIVADLGKLLIVRTRPGGSDLTAGVQATFLGWRPLIEVPLVAGQSKSLYQSFPSGHTATAVGLAVALACAYPRGRWFFAGMALLAALQRVGDGHHFVSDTLAGASVAFLWCGAIAPWLARATVSAPEAISAEPPKLRTAA